MAGVGRRTPPGKAAAGGMDAMGFRPGLPNAVAAGLGEAGGARAAVTELC